MDKGANHDEQHAVRPEATGGARLPFHYDAHLANEIEERWQRRWQAEGTFDSPNPVGPLGSGFDAMAGRRKFYVLDMFPYPSGSGLHVGHPLGYIGTDVFARYLRMTGYHVLHTFGYDAFGLPAEQYAIDTGQHPAVTTQGNIDNMRAQLRRLGLAHDTRREVATTDPAFYRWTQWIFLQIFNSWCDETGRARPIDELVSEFASGRRLLPGGSAWSELSEVEQRRLIDGYRLAYISEELVNWCPGLGTVLANEEVTADGRSDIGNYPVYRRPLRQWMLRITAFAERLLADLDTVDWPESIKQMQRNWIGASDGANIDLPVTGNTDDRIRVFTTRPDTLPGATYVVLAPEHPMVDRLVADAWPAGTPDAWRSPQDGEGPRRTPEEAVTAYREATARLSDRQRAEDGYGETGVFTGGYVVNPATGESIPVFVADYVLMGYGTGAIMAVPAHDERDLEFARAFGLDVRAVLAPSATWLADRDLPMGAPAAEWPDAFTGDGDYTESPIPGMAGLAKADGIDTTIGWLEPQGFGTRVRSYRLRDWLFSRQRYWGEPFPIVYDEHDLPIALPDDALPVTLPEMSDFRPVPHDDDEVSDPVPPLARVPGWADVTLDLGDGPKKYRRELNTMPQWAGSCWYYLRYLDPTNDEAFVDPRIERYWMDAAAGPAAEGGVDLYVGGVEHAVLHLLYARFWHKVLYDLGHVSTREPFRRLYNQGYILADAFTDARGMYVPAADVIQHENGRCTYQGESVTRRAGKMGKSLKNAVSPDDMYAAYGADTLRLYEMAMGPMDADRPWRTDDIIGVHRFLKRLWRAIIDETTGATHISDDDLDEDTAHLLHRTIKAVSDDLAAMRFNTAIARLIVLTTHATKLVTARGALPRTIAEPLALMVAPLAPHIAEELWARLGHEASLTHAPFPRADETLAVEESVTLPVQVDGKTRFTLQIRADATREDIERAVTDHDTYPQYTAGRTVKRLVIVPGKIVNIVT